MESVNLEVAETLRYKGMYLLFFGLVLICASVYFKQTQNLPLWFRNFIILYFGLPYVWVSYYNGLTTATTALFTLGITVVGLFLFNQRIVLLACSMCVSLIVILTLGIHMGYVPQPDLFILGEDGSQSNVWLITQFVFDVPMLAILLFIICFLLKGLGDREQTIRELSRTDELTNTWNRRYLMEQFDREISIAVRDSSPLSFIILDLDHFKKINDNYGHQVGDHILRQTSDVLRRCIRTTDVLGRYGGEEFGIVLPNCDEFTARKISERCRSEIQRIIIAPTNSTKESQALCASASFGVASFSVRGLTPSSPAPTIESIIEQADKALYRAKHSGRNQVVYANSIHV